MIKRLLTLVAAAAAISFGASADTLPLPLNELGSGWDSSYDAATKTITFDKEWTGRGWWLEANGVYADYSAYDEAVVKFEAVTFDVKLVVEYREAGISSDAIVPAGKTEVVVALDEAYKNAVKQIYIQASAAGTLTLTDAYLQSAAAVDPTAPVVLWEGDLVLDNWNAGAEFASSKVKAGDIICYTFDPATAGGQVLLKNSGWGNLMGSTKIAPADMEAGKVYVGITEEMLSDCGGKIFLQGEGKCKVTKVEKTGETFNPAGIIAYGKRNPGVEFYTKIPESATTVAVVFDKAPEWAAFCAGSWTDSELACTVTTNSDNTVTYTYTLTADAISKVNGGSTPVFIINGGGAAVLYAYYPDAITGIADITVDENAPVEFFNLQGVRVANPENGLYIRRQGNKTTKVFVK